MTTDVAASAGGAPAVPETVLVVGTGLIGTSVGLALRRHGVTVHLADTDPAALSAAVDRGAGEVGPPATPADVGVLCVPPGATAATLRDVQADGLARVWTDTASVKAAPLAGARALGADLGRVVGGHPMAGAESSGPVAARGDLFAGRPWVLTPTDETAPDALATVRALLALTGAVPVTATPSAHDAAVAAVSHTPHVVASLLAGLLVDADPLALEVAGRGVRDTVRVAASPASLWRDILVHNPAPVADGLDRLAADLTRAREALHALAAGGAPVPGEGGAPAPGPGGAADDAVTTLTDLLTRGRRGHARLPGKHGADRADRSVAVVLDDRPGRLAALFADVADAGVNVEDVTIDHAPGQPQGLVRLAVRPDAADGLVARLVETGWSARPGP